jgi:polysaccharide pyruvyl transferase CsaB
MRVVLSGYYGFGNLGDEAVLAGLLRTLRSTEPDIQPTVLSGDPGRTEREHAVEAIPRMHPGSLVAALRAADGLISGGGSLLQDRSSVRPVAYYAGVMLAARLLGRPYVVHAQGLGPIEHRANRGLAAMALRGAAAVSLRDAASVALARSIGVRRPIEIAPDPALALEGRDRPAEGDGPIVVAVRAWPSVEPLLDAIRTALADLADLGPVVAVPMQSPADVEPSHAAVRGIPGATVLGPEPDLDVVLRSIAGARVVVGMRLHALILAAGAGVPAVAVSYDPKVDAFADRAAQPIVARIDEPVDSVALALAIRAAADADRAPTRARVDAMRAELGAATRRSLGALRGPMR